MDGNFVSRGSSVSREPFDGRRTNEAGSSASGILSSSNLRYKLTRSAPFSSDEDDIGQEPQCLPSTESIPSLITSSDNLNLNSNAKNQLYRGKKQNWRNQHDSQQNKLRIDERSDRTRKCQNWKGRGRSRQNNQEYDKMTWKSHKFEQKTFPLGFKKLEDWLQGNPEDLLLKLIENSDAFALLLAKTDLSPDAIVLVVSTLSKLSNAYMNQQKLKLIHIVIKELFVDKLIGFLCELPLHNERDKDRAKVFWTRPKNFFENLKIFCEMILTMLPTNAINLLPRLIKAVRISVNHVLSVNDSIINEYDSIENTLISMISAHEKKTVRPDVSADIEQQPPENFREVSVFPQPFEITSKVYTYLRENVVTGAYRDIEHYLDVQFRLVRNDFVKPLRDGICSYLDPSCTQRVQNIKVYKGVKFIKAEITNSNAANSYLIQLPKCKKQPFHRAAENPRIFMFGSLVLFTKDNFTTVLFAQIVERELESLRDGKLVVSLHSDKNLIDFSADYLMIESKVYFEPYYHVLTALQQISERDFPMRDFIIYVKEDTALPDYYTHPNQKITEDEDELNFDIKSYTRYTIPIENGILVNEKWPTMDQLDLNESQYEAYKRALTTKFAIIQGPPGTGKTYLGLTIARALLHNHHLWYRKQHPMLVICFTNHALDQFLEGLLSTTTQIVRIGGQSKNETLKPYNLKQLRTESHSRVFRDHRNALENIANKLKSLADQLEATRTFHGIVNIKPLFHQLPELRGTRFPNVKIEGFTEWLLGRSISGRDRLLSYLDNAPEMQEKEHGASDEFFHSEEWNRVENDMVDDIQLKKHQKSCFMITLSDYIKNQQYIDERFATLVENQHINSINSKEWHMLEIKCHHLKSDYDRLRIALEKGKKITDSLLPPKLHPRLLRNPDYIWPEFRWHLYFYWLKLYRTKLLAEILQTEEEFQRVSKEYEDVRNLIDLEVIRGKLVVGMTTTAAARLQSLIRVLRSRVVIVEEAAEIMEAHVITALTEHCEQVILIGDHKQLRPSTADYMMETKFKLGISLFERMINNNIQCNLLQIQHRMRPEIAKLIISTIYPDLKNDQSVYHFQPVMGMQKNLYFIHHTNEETKESNDSKLNLYEVKYLLLLSHYLIQNGYLPEDITILVAYSAQLFKMFRERKQYPLLANVRICVLDNYQGEESKIILLSLVRNNPEGNVGFLKIENRICVALSRAREGFYIMGNMDMLTSSSNIWQKIKSTLEQESCIGNALPLSCSIHRNKITLIKSIEDFEKVSEGGCDEICNKVLACGHTCKAQCHVVNVDHAISTCRQPCTRVCDRDHICPKMCSEECGLCMLLVEHNLECGHTGTFPCHDKDLKCKVIVTVKLDCEHEAEKPCFKPNTEVYCPHPCDVRLDKCGHACSKKCHIFDDPDHLEFECAKECDEFLQNCSMKTDDHRCRKLCYEDCGECQIPIEKHRSCGHVYKLACSVNVETIQCEKKCKKTLDCKHPCKLKCWEPCGNCNVKVKTTVPGCEHNIETLCGNTVSTRNCTGPCPKLLLCGHQCQNRCSDSCTIRCKVLVRSSDQLICRHHANIPCWMNTKRIIETDKWLVKYCREPCGKTLECTHACGGSCGECFQGRLHVPCKSECGVTLVCGHVCKAPCREMCPPCKEKCEFGCVHRKCNKKCGEPCSPCSKPCTRRCKHQACRGKCGELCTVGPCEKPCSMRLSCGHSCIGFCGDPCPKLCKVCNHEEVMEEMYVGYKNDEDIRFVQLVDCEHAIESRKMKNWLNSSLEEIGNKRCPKCKQTIVNTKRYSDYVKTSLQNIVKAKYRFYINDSDNRKIANDRQTTLVRMYKKTSLKNTFPIIDILYNTFTSQLKPFIKYKKQMLSNLKFQVVTSKIQILNNICNIYDNTFRIKTTTPITDYKNYVFFLLERLQLDLDQITSQEILDYEVELKRFRRMMQLEFVRLGVPGSQTTPRTLIDIQECLYSPKPYDIANDTKLKKVIEKLQGIFGLVNVTEQQLTTIVKPVKFKSGVWYNSPEGHLYAIDERSRTIEMDNCSYCRSIVADKLKATHANICNARNVHANIGRGSRLLPGRRLQTYVAASVIRSRITD